MQSVFNLYKSVGQTPLQLIEELRHYYPEYQRLKLGYAGRLDPMAEGVMLILVGNENKRRKLYEALSKTYEFDALLGISTDSYDLLGKITTAQLSFPKQLSNRIKTFTLQSIGKHMQPYPPYSSKPVLGKPLFKWAREDKLHDIRIPEKEIMIHAFFLVSSKKITVKQLEHIIVDRINKVQGVFRQKEILLIWDKFFRQHSHATFPVFRFQINCSSGTYIRSIIHRIGNTLGTGGVALNIKRINVGSYSLHDAINLSS